MLSDAATPWRRKSASARGSSAWATAVWGFVIREHAVSTDFEVPPRPATLGRIKPADGVWRLNVDISLVPPPQGEPIPHKTLAAPAAPVPATPPPSPKRLYRRMIVVMDLEWRPAVVARFAAAPTVARFVGASAFINAIWFLVALPRYTTDAAALTVGTVAFYGQGILFVLGLWAARRFWATPRKLSWRTLAGVALGQPMTVIVSGLLVVYADRHSHPSLATGVYLLASLLGGAPVAACLRWDTRAWVPRSAVAMLFFAAAWAVVPIAISRGWDAGVLHTGVLGQGSNRVVHPFVTALWQVPMAGLVASWLVGVSQPAKSRQVG